MSEIDGRIQTEEAWMRLAIGRAREGFGAGQSPFGAAIVKRGELIASTHNSVRRDIDPTAHAEVNCIRAATGLLGTIDLTGCTLYSTCEPCPMCLAAIHWARLDRVVFGAAISDAEAAGFRELTIPAEALVRLGGSALIVEGGLLAEECAALFDEWTRSGRRSD